MKTYKNFIEERSTASGISSFLIGYAIGYGVVALFVGAVAGIDKLVQMHNSGEDKKIIKDLNKKIKSSPEKAKQYMIDKMEKAKSFLKNPKKRNTAIVTYWITVVLMYYFVVHSDLDNAALNKIRKSTLERAMKDGEFYNPGPIVDLANKIIDKLKSAN